MSSLISIPGYILSTVILKFLFLDDCMKLKRVLDHDFLDYIYLSFSGSHLIDCGRVIDNNDLAWMHVHNLSSQTISLKCYVNTLIVSKLTRMWNRLKELNICSLNESVQSTIDASTSSYLIQTSNYPAVSTPRSLESIHIYGSRPLSDDLAWQLLSGCTYLKAIRIDTRGIDLISSTLTSILFDNPNLLSFEIKNFHNLTADNIIALSQNCKQLRSLNETDCHFNSEERYHEFIQNCKSLQTLNFSQNHFELDPILELIANNLFQLQSLDISRCRIIDRNTLIQVCKCCRQLHTLLMGHIYNVNEEIFITIVTNCSQLRVLDISGHPRVTDNVLAAIAEHCEQLHTFNISHCSTISDIGLLILSRLNDSLQSINIVGCNFTFTAMRHFAQKCCRIHTFIASVPNCDDVSTQMTDVNENIWAHIFPYWLDLTVLKLSESPSPTSTLSFNHMTLSALRTLHLTKLPHLCDDELAPLFQYCHRLEDVSFTGCILITDVSIVSLTQNNHNLHSFETTKLKITDRSLFSLADHCRQLEYFAVREANVSESGMLALITACQALQNLFFSGIGVTDRVLLELSKSSNLKNLDIRACGTYTDVGILKILRGCPRLEEFSVSSSVHKPHLMRYLDLGRYLLYHY